MHVPNLAAGAGSGAAPSFIVVRDEDDDADAGSDYYNESDIPEEDGSFNVQHAD